MERRNWARRGLVGRRDLETSGYARRGPAGIASRSEEVLGAGR